jgi:predicted acyl esterase
MTRESDLASVRSVNPSSLPQYPFDSPPALRESSKPTYAIESETDIFIPMRDGVKLAADVFRPSAPGKRFPGLVAASGYGRQLQRTAIPTGQNESGLPEFWVPRGYVHVIVDVRGTNDSEGSWQMEGPLEQQDLFDLVEWVARQPWCDGNVGMTGESYYAASQLRAATQRPPHLKAIFPQCGSVDRYRDTYYVGGIFNSARINWLYVFGELNGRQKNIADIHRHVTEITSQQYPLDGPYYQDRSAWPRLGQIRIPTYIVGNWKDIRNHTRGAFETWEGVAGVPKRMAIGLGGPAHTSKPTGAYHQEALRWYDHYLKGMDTRVIEGPPIQLYIRGAGQWRGEQEWPLAGTQWRELFLAGDGAGGKGRLADSPEADAETTYNYDPSTLEAYRGGPKIVYRSEPIGRDLEVTGPLALHLWAVSSATDANWFVELSDEAPDGQVQMLTRGCLRASHRELDAVRSKPYRPFHPHARTDPLTPNQAYEFAIEIWPTCNLFQSGHRMRLEIASCDDQSVINARRQPLILAARNTILEGHSYPSRLLVPVVPPR